MKFCPATIFILIIILTGCNDQKGCYESVDTRIIASFKTSEFRVYDTLFVQGTGRTGTGDTLVYDILASQSKRYPLALSLSEDSTGFVIHAGGRRDTVYILHSMTMKFISEYCGFAPEYHLKGTLFTSGIDSINISDAIVDTHSIDKNVNDQNITIYFNFSVP
jgi:hypothetical protein